MLKTIIAAAIIATCFIFLIKFIFWFINALQTIDFVLRDNITLLEENIELIEKQHEIEEVNQKLTRKILQYQLDEGVTIEEMEEKLKKGEDILGLQEEP